MTLGERIANLRKEKGLSQEALGELVGVSRQAVSKWEADRAIPDVNNCVAMSRVFGVSLEALLELEEAGTSSFAGATSVEGASKEKAELDERHLQLVEQMIEKYIGAQKRLRRRWRWPAILVVAALVVGMVWMWEWLSDMNRTIEYLSGELAGLRGEIISGVGEQMQENLEEENRLITDYNVSIKEADVIAGTLVYDISVNLKSGSEETAVSLMARCGTEVVEAPMTWEAGLSYRGQITCPILDDTDIHLVVEAGGQSQSQLLDTFYPEADYAIHVDGYRSWATLEQSGLVKNACESVEVYATFYPAPGLAEPLTMTRVEVGVFCNDVLVEAFEVDSAQGMNGPQADGTCHGCQMDIPVSQDVAEEGDTLTFVLMAWDNYGRSASHILSRYRVLENGALETLDQEALALNDGTYGLE